MPGPAWRQQRIAAACHRLLDDIWYGKHPARALLAPLGWLFRAYVWLRRTAYTSGLVSAYRAPVPVIIVGNISVGGTGKTPLVIWIAHKLHEYGFKPGVIARGYRGRATRWPQQVRSDSDAVTVGDEAIVLSRRTGMPVAVGPNRGDDIDALLRHADVNIIVSDDGLQHYGLARDIEVAVVDGVRRHGNGACVPAGPLREPTARLDSVDLIVTRGIAARGEFAMRYVAERLIRVGGNGEAELLSTFAEKTVHAVAGIGNPEGFFALLKRQGFRITPHVFPDHHGYVPQDFAFDDDWPVIMTEKDAVKCEHFNDERLWYMPIEAELPEVFERRFKTLLRKIFDGQKAA